MTDIEDDYDFADEPIVDLKPLAEAIQKALAPEPLPEPPKPEAKNTLGGQTPSENPKIIPRRKVIGMM